MRLKIYEPVYEAIDRELDELTEADYEICYDGELICLGLRNLFYSFTGRDAPYAYFGRSMGRGHVVCIYGSALHGKYLCERDDEPCFSRIEFNERLAYNGQE